MDFAFFEDSHVRVKLIKTCDFLLLISSCINWAPWFSQRAHARTEEEPGPGGSHLYVILAIQEAEIRRISVQSQPRQIVCQTLSRKYTSQKGLAEWLKVKVLSSSPGSAKKKKKKKNPEEDWVDLSVPYSLISFPSNDPPGRTGRIIPGVAPFIWSSAVSI
jgi:hypothetical protein